jgi:hypothetical protein
LTFQLIHGNNVANRSVQMLTVGRIAIPAALWWQQMIQNLIQTMP